MSLRTCALAVFACAAIACGADVEGEPAPTCVTQPQLCPGPAMDGGVPTGAIVADAPRGFEPFDPTDPADPGVPDEPDQPPVEPCGGERILCDGVCVDPLSDPDHCGRCGMTCRAEQQCRVGQCCDFDDALCDGVCTDVSSDERNCGTCGFVCDAGLECVLGVCTPDGTPPGF